MAKSKIRLHKLVSNLSKSKEYNFSRAEISKNIEYLGVFIDNKLIKNRLEWAEDWQEVDLSHWQNQINNSKEEFEKLTSKIKILKDEKDYFVIFKPSGLVVQPGSGHQEDNLINWLTKNFEHQKKLLEEGKIYDKNGNLSNSWLTAGLVHRLDKDTSGILLIAKNRNGLELLQTEFRNRNAVKKYLTVLHGKLENEIEIEGWQSRSKKDPIKQIFFWNETEAKNYHPEARNNHSIFRPLFFCKNLNQTICEVQIMTGRMHQIRLQAENIEMPVLGDQIYNKPNKNKTEIKFEILKSEIVQEIEESKFLELKKNIFEEMKSFYLLSNYLKVNSDQLNLEIQYIVKNLDFLEN